MIPKKYCTLHCMLKFEFYHFRRGEGRTAGGRRRRFQLRIDFLWGPKCINTSIYIKSTLLWFWKGIYCSLCVYHVEAGIQPFSGGGGNCSSGLNFFVGSQITWHEYFCKGYIVLIPKRYYTPYLMFNPTMSKYSFFAPRGENFDPLAQSLKVNEFHLFFGWSVFLPKIMIYVKGTLLRFRKGVTHCDLYWSWNSSIFGAGGKLEFRIKFFSGGPRCISNNIYEKATLFWFRKGITHHIQCWIPSCRNIPDLLQGGDLWPPWGTPKC